MKVRILESAKEDLKEGFFFYERQKQGLGHYFTETLLSDIESLRASAGIHSIHFGNITVCFQNASLLQYII